MLGEPEPGPPLPQISSDGSGGVAPAWHATLLFNASLPRSVNAEGVDDATASAGNPCGKRGNVVSLKPGAVAPFTG